MSCDMSDTEGRAILPGPHQGVLVSRAVSVEEDGGL